MRRTLLTLTGILALLVPVMVLASGLPCGFLGGGCTSSQHVPRNAIVPLGQIFVVTTAGASVLFVLVGATLILLNVGDESMVQRGRNSILYALAGLGITFFAQSIVLYVSDTFTGLDPSGSDTAVEIMTRSVNAIKNLFSAIFLVMVIFAGCRMIYARGKTDEFAKAKTMAIWCGVAAVLVNLTHAMVQAVLNLF